jgi:hypothetical protein
VLYRWRRFGGGGGGGGGSLLAGKFLTGNIGSLCEQQPTTSQLDIFWPANFRPIPQKDSAWDAYTAKETENRQGEVGFLRYSPYGP